MKNCEKRPSLNAMVAEILPMSKRFVAAGDTIVRKQEGRRVRNISGVLVAAAMAVCAVNGTAQKSGHWAIVLHGGAGVIEHASMKPDTEAAYRASLKQALEAGAAVLDRGGSSLDAVEAAIRI